MKTIKLISLGLLTGIIVPTIIFALKASLFLLTVAFKMMIAVIFSAR